MKVSLLHTTLAILLAAWAAGCATLPTAERPAYSASYAGDHAGLDLTEVEVALPMGGDVNEHQNLHVKLSATINPRGVWLQREGDVKGILRRAKPRLAAQVIRSALAA